MANYSSVVRTLSRIYTNNPEQACMIWGAPGCGKTHSLATGLRDAMGLPQVGIEHPDSAVSMFRPSNHDPVDVTGLPDLSSGTTTFRTPDFLLEVNEKAERHGRSLFIIDELNQAVPMMFNTLNGLLLDRMVGKFRLHPGVMVACTGNRQTDKAASNRMPSHTANRLFHMDMESDYQAWSVWALKQQLPVWAVAYINMKPANLNCFDPDKRENATERSWEMFCRSITEESGPEEVGQIARGYLGDGIAAELQAFRKVMDDMPNPDGCLLDPKNAKLPETLSGKYAMAGAMASRAKKGNFDSVLTYMGRLEKQFEVLTVRSAYIANPEITATGAFITWAAENASVFTTV